MPLEGGARMMEELKARARKWRSARVSAGFFQPKYATLAFLMDAGFLNHDMFVAPRPFFLRAVEGEKDNWAKRLRNRLKKGDSAREALNNVGELMRTDIQLYLLSSHLYNSNMPRTIKKKGFDRPLFETGRLSKKIKFRVSSIPAGGE